jgi:PIN domain nuclease of toxin-antitoxin system
VRLLLDTHAFLWWCADDPRLSQGAVRAVSDGSNEVLVSAVSGWEVAIKTRLGKLPLAGVPEAFMARMLERHAFSVLSITMRHALRDYGLPAYHSDPFDRLLVAQAQLEGLTLVTDDALIRRYEVETLW